MKHGLLVPLGLLGLWALGGCAHVSNRRGTVAMKISKDEVHVALGSDDVKKGDHLTFYQNQCVRPKSYMSPSEKPISPAEPGGLPRCEKVKVGEGTVAEVLNKDYSIAKLSPGSKADEGTVVEKG